MALTSTLSARTKCCDDTYAYGIKVQHFRGGTPRHNYYVPAGSSNPVLLLVEDIYEAWHFTAPFAVGPQDPRHFVLTSNCSNDCSNAAVARRLVFSRLV